MSDKKAKTFYKNESHLELIEKLYLNPEIADVYFDISPNNDSVERIPAHKILLAVVSEVFKKMFFGELTEREDVKLVDASAGAFKEFLQFSYLSEVKLTEENIAEVLNLGHKYNVAKCIDICEQFLKDNLKSDLACSALNLAIFYNQVKLLEDCKRYIAINTSEVLKSDDFLNCDNRALEYILKMDYLSSSEVEVFEACMSWVKAKSKQDILTKEIVETHLGDLFQEIRFKSMTAKEFFILSDAHDAVLASDFRNIMKMIIQPEFRSLEFNNKLRQNCVIECNRIECELTKYYELDRFESSIFTTNQPLQLISFICQKVDKFIENELKTALSVNVTIYRDGDDGKKEKLLNMMTEMLPDGTEVTLSSPVSIEPGKKYTISLSNIPLDRYRYQGVNLKSEVSIDSDITINFHDDLFSEGKLINIITGLKFQRCKTTNCIDVE